MYRSLHPVLYGFKGTDAQGAAIAKIQIEINGTLPPQYKDAELIDIADDMGIGYHAVIPDFRDYFDANGDEDLGLGIYKFKAIPYSVKLHNVKKAGEQKE